MSQDAGTNLRLKLCVMDSTLRSDTAQACLIYNLRLVCSVRRHNKFDASLWRVGALDENHVVRMSKESGEFVCISVKLVSPLEKTPT